MLVLEGVVLMARKACRRCRHCRRKKANRSRGLCWGCFYDPTIRAKYPPQGIRGEFGIRAHQGEAFYDTGRPIPTWSPPGSDRKIEVMRKRAERRQDLFHPLDASEPLDVE